MSEVFFDTNVLLRIFNEEAGFEETIEDIAEIKMERVMIFWKSMGT